MIIFEHKYLGYNEIYHEYYCDMIDDSRNDKYVGYCKYSKEYYLDNYVVIEYITVKPEYRRMGYGTKLIQEILTKYKILWDGRFTDQGRLFYDGLVKKRIISH